MDIVTDGEMQLTTLAGLINEEHRLCEASLREGLQHAINAGQLLIKAKGLCQHGTWGDWLREHCNVAERTAQVYMRVAKGLPLLEGKAQRVADLSLREAVALLVEPIEPDAPDEIQQATNIGESLAAISNELPSLEKSLADARTFEDCVAVESRAFELQNKAAELRLRAERGAGRCLNALELNPGVKAAWKATSRW